MERTKASQFWQTSMDILNEEPKDLNVKIKAIKGKL